MPCFFLKRASRSFRLSANGTALEPKSCERSRRAPRPYWAWMKERNREPTVYCPKPRGQASGRLESVSIRGSFPSSTSARTTMSSSEERTRPAPLTSLSAKVAIPSMNQRG